MKKKNRELKLVRLQQGDVILVKYDRNTENNESMHRHIMPACRRMQQWFKDKRGIDIEFCFMGTGIELTVLSGSEDPLKAKKNFRRIEL